MSQGLVGASVRMTRGRLTKRSTEAVLGGPLEKRGPGEI